MVTSFHKYKISTEMNPQQVNKYTWGEIGRHSYRVLAMCFTHGKSVHFLPFTRTVGNAF